VLVGLCLPILTLSHSWVVRSAFLSKADLGVAVERRRSVCLLWGWMALALEVPMASQSDWSVAMCRDGKRE
jgi:hypothetical protein